MRITYYTTDEVNRYIVRQWGRRAGIRVECPADRRRAAGGDGPVILDLDFLPADVRAGWLFRLRVGQIAGPVLVHGHNIAEPDAAALAGRGVKVCRGRIRRAALDGWLDTVTAGRQIS